MDLTADREQIVRTARGMLEVGLVIGTSGNVSSRHGERLLVTPSSADYERMSAEDVVVAAVQEPSTADQGQGQDEDRRASSELPLHRALYLSSPEVAAVVHTHSRFATAVGLVLDELPAVHYGINGLGGPVRVAAYATFGTAELAASVTTALHGRTGALMRNHGAVTTGTTLAEAFERAVRLEWLCELWWRASCVGPPATLTEQQLREAREQATGRGYR